MTVAAMLVVERGGRPVPLCRTRQKEVVQLVADAVLRELRQASDGETDEVLSVLLRQERERVEKALATLHITGVAQCSA